MIIGAFSLLLVACGHKNEIQKEDFELLVSKRAIHDLVIVNKKFVEIRLDAGTMETAGLNGQYNPDKVYTLEIESEEAFLAYLEKLQENIPEEGHVFYGFEHRSGIGSFIGIWSLLLLAITIIVVVPVTIIALISRNKKG